MNDNLNSFVLKSIDKEEIKLILSSLDISRTTNWPDNIPTT